MQKGAQDGPPVEPRDDREGHRPRRCAGGHRHLHVGGPVRRDWHTGAVDTGSVDTGSVDTGSVDTGAVTPTAEPPATAEPTTGAERPPAGPAEQWRRRLIAVTGAQVAADPAVGAQLPLCRCSSHPQATTTPPQRQRQHQIRAHTPRHPPLSGHSYRCTGAAVTTPKRPQPPTAAASAPGSSAYPRRPRPPTRDHRPMAPARRGRSSEARG